MNRPSAPAGLAVGVFDTPFGPIEACAHDERISAVRFCWADPPRPVGRAEVLERFGAELHAYVAGEAQRFTVSLDWDQLEGLRREVLVALTEVPYGTRSTYGELAGRVGDRGLARAVGGVLRSNPWVIVVPCHRVVAASGALTGYGGGPRTGGRLDVKAALLAHEKGYCEQRLFDD